MDSITLTLELLKRIPRHRKVTAGELHAQLRDAGMERTKRSIERQLVALCDSFDIECDNRSKPFGYSWKPLSAGLSLPGLNAQEALLLMLAEKQLAQLLPASLKSSLSPFFEQAKRLLQNAQIDTSSNKAAHAASEWLDKVRVISTSVPVLPPKLEEGVFEAVSETLLHNRMLNIVYRNAKGEVKEKRIKPLGLAQAEARMFLVCIFDGYSDTRNLALHRILSAKDTGMPFDRPTDFDLKTYDDNGYFSYGNGSQIQLCAWVSDYLALLLQETPLSEDQTLTTMLEPEPCVSEQPRNGYKLEATVVQSDLLVRWLKSQGKGVSILEPNALRERVLI